MVMTLALLTPFMFIGAAIIILIIEKIRLRRAYNRFIQELRAENAKRVRIGILRSEWRGSRSSIREARTGTGFAPTSGASARRCLTVHNGSSNFLVQTLFYLYKFSLSSSFFFFKRDQSKEKRKRKGRKRNNSSGKF